MSIQEYLEKMTAIQNSFLEYLDKSNEYEEEYHGLIKLLDTHNIKTNHHDLKSFLHMIIKVCNNHIQTFDFYAKVERILAYIKTEIKQSFSNYDIFIIFRSNKKLLLYLIKEKILELTQYIAETIIYGKYSKLNYIEFLYPEIKQFLPDDMIESVSKSLPENFEENRQIGSNHFPLCRIIQNDSIDEFIAYVNEKNIYLGGTINHSIFETNSFLNKTKNITLIQYAAFNDSIRIFKYLIMNKVEINDDLFQFVIHSNNAEMINLLQEEHYINYSNYVDIIRESIRCHHSNIADYFFENMDNKIESDDSLNILKTSLKYYNFSYIKKDEINKDIFRYLCEYDYYQLVDIILKTYGDEIEFIFILNHFKIYGILKKTFFMKFYNFIFLMKFLKSIIK